MCRASDLRPDPPLVLWDGDCGFCGRCVGWAMAQDRAGRLDFRPFQEVEGLSPELRSACRHAVHVVKPDGEVLRAGKASLFVLGLVGWPRLAALLGMPPLLWGVELGYRLVAANRGRLSRWL